MPESVGLPWYSTGTVTLTQGSTDVVGVGTNWKNAGLKIGDIFTIDRVTLYMIASVNSNTSITLAQAYAGTSGNTMNYYVIRNFAATLQAELSGQVSQLVGDYESWKDGRVNEIAIPFDFSSLYKGVWATGRSYKALDIVMYNSALYVCLLAHTSASGNTPGTAGAINYWGSYAPAMPAGIDVLNYDNYNSHNSIARGKSLGSEITAEQIANIRNLTFKDLYIGDYWTFKTSHNQTLNATIMHFIRFWNQASTRPAGVVVKLSGISWDYAIDGGISAINDTNTCEGHIYNSKMYNEVLPAILAQVESYIDPSYILEVTDLVADAISSSTGDVNHRIEAAGKIFLPSARNINLIRYDATSANCYKPYQNTGWQMLNSLTWAYYQQSYGGGWGHWLASNENTSSWHTGGTGFNGRCGVYPIAAGNSNGLEPFIIIG